MSLPHSLVRCLTIGTSALVLGSFGTAQITGAPTPAPQEFLRRAELSAATIQMLEVPQGALPRIFRVPVVLGDDAVTLTLATHEVRAPDYKLLVDNGEGYTEVPRTPCVTYRGSVQGRPGSVVAAGLVNGQLQAVVTYNNETWAIDPANEFLAALPQAAHVIYRGRDNRHTGRCGLDDNPPRDGGAGPWTRDPSPQQQPPGGTQTPTGTMKVFDMGIDCTSYYYILNNRNITQTQNNATVIVNAMSLIYERDVLLQATIKRMVVRTTQVYPSPDTGSILSFMPSRWASLPRTDVRLAISGNPSGRTVGSALLGVVCNRSSQNAAMRNNSSLARRRGVAAHEIGHTFNAPHCNSAPGSCQIMCATLGSCSGITSSFGNYSKVRIRAFKASRGCLSNPTTGPTLSNISPSAVSSHNSPPITLTGTGLGTVTKVTVSGTDITNVSTTSTSVTFSLPDPFLIATHEVTATSPAGTTNTVHLIVRGNHPPVLVAPPTHVSGTTQSYQCYTDRRWVTVWYISPSNVPSAFSTVTLGIGNNGTQLFGVLSAQANKKGLANVPLTPMAGFTGLYYWDVICVGQVPPTSTPYETTNEASTVYQ